MEKIKELSIERIRENCNVPSLGDDLLLFSELKMLPELDEPRRMNCLIVAVCTGGRGGYTLNQEEHDIKSGDAMILTDGQVVDKIWMSDDIKGIALLISNPFIFEILKDVRNLSLLFLLTRNHPVFPMESKEIRTANEYFKMIEERVVGMDYPFRKDVLRLLLLTMIYDLGSAYYRVMNSSELFSYDTKGEKVFVEFIQLVEKHCRHERRVSWYAEQLGLTPKYLSEIISNVSKCTPNAWIDKYVTKEIRILLRQTDMKICDIAKELNFPNQSFLGKYFRENVGVSPNKYRKGIEGE